MQSFQVRHTSFFIRNHGVSIRGILISLIFWETALKNAYLLDFNKFMVYIVIFGDFV